MINEFFEAWNYLSNHEIFDGHFNECLDIEVVKINPKTMEIDDNIENNTKVEIWLECGPYLEETLTHDIDLDCGGFSFEEAIIKLSELVKQFYDNGDNIKKYKK